MRGSAGFFEKKNYLAVVGPILRGSAGTAGHDYVQSRPQLWLYFAGRPGAFVLCVCVWIILDLGIVTALPLEYH